MHYIFEYFVTSKVTFREISPKNRLETRVKPIKSLRQRFSGEYLASISDNDQCLNFYRIFLQCSRSA